MLANASSFLLLWFGLSLVEVATCPGVDLVGTCINRSRNKFNPSEEDYDDESPGLVVRRKVKLPEDCGRFKGSFSGRPLKTLNLPRVNLGYDAKVGQFPSFVELKVNDYLTFNTCGGTILTSRHILTAAHCVAEQLAENMKLGFGLKSYMSNGVKDFEISAERYCISSRYQRNKWTKDLKGPLVTYDVAIIKLNRDIKFSDVVQPACLPRPGNPLRNQQQAFSVGSGYMYRNLLTGRVEKPTTLQVQPNTRVDCPETDRHQAVICHRANRANYLGVICSGDSGGPFMALNLDERQTVYGIHSYSSVACMGWDLDSADDDQVENNYRIGKSADVYNVLEEIYNLLEECE